MQPRKITQLLSDMLLKLSSLLALLPLSVLAATYSRTNRFAGNDFFANFGFQAVQDPTNGRVNYVDGATSASLNLAYSPAADSFIVRADDTTVLNPNGPGRNSVRLQSYQQFETGVTVFNLRHMPEGCGTWPAVWTVGNNWPYNGEIDILEGVNNQGSDSITLHTSPGCSMPASRDQTGTSGSNNCDTAATGNVGCGVIVDDSRSFGPTFNSQGGGWFALERTDSFIKVWFWSNTDVIVPSDVRSGSESVNTGNWGTPRAFFPNTDCNIASHFGPHNIIIDLTFCGDWAGSVYGQSGCPSTCVDFVNNNPSAFSNAYFDFVWLNTYT